MINDGVTIYSGYFELNLDYTIGGFDITENDITISISADTGITISYDFHLKTSINYWMIIAIIGLSASLVISILWVISINRIKQKMIISNT